MTDDLTDRLRAITVAEEIEECLLPDELVTLAEAADEIDRLRSVLRQIVASGAYPEAAIAQEALTAGFTPAPTDDKETQ